MKKKILSIASAGIAFVAITGAVFAADTTPTATKSDLPTIKAHHKQQGHFNNEELLNLLGIDFATLQQEIQAGKSLGDIAAAKNKTQGVIDLFVKQESKRIDQAVTSGKLTQEKADQMKAKLPERVKERLEHKGFFDGKHRVKHKGNHAKTSNNQFKEIASILGVDTKEMMTKIKAGGSIAEIAKDHNVDEQELINKLLEKDKERITKMVEKKWQKHEPSGSNPSNTSTK